MPKKSTKVHELDTIVALTIQVALLTCQLGSMVANAIHTPVETCEIYDGAHISIECQANSSYVQAQFM